MTQTGFKQLAYDDEDSSSGESDEFNNSMDKEELETYQDDSNSHLYEYDNDDSMMKHSEKLGNSSFLKDNADLDEDDSEDIIDGESTSDSEADVDVAGPSSDTPHLGSAKQPSLYLLENAKKKIVLKDGKLVAARQKAQRKDKGVSNHSTGR